MGLNNEEKIRIILDGIFRIRFVFSLASLNKLLLY